MAAGIDKQLVLAYYQKMCDEEIIAVLTKDVKGLTEEAQEIIKGEIERRRLSPEILEAVQIQQQVYVHVPKEFDPEGCGVDEDTRIWLEQSFEFLLNLFGKEETLQRKVLVPDSIDFPVRYNGSEDSAFKTLEIVAKQMEVSAQNISLDFYNEDTREITEGNPGGLYWGESEDGNFEISLAISLLEKPENMVATLAHEVAHIKLLGEGRMDDNDERLTDLTTLFFGLGIFNANTAFQTSRNNRYYEWSTSGYLSQMEWGYALALFAYARKEDTPDWVKHLTTNLKADFKQSQNYILNNKHKLTIDL